MAQDNQDQPSLLGFIAGLLAGAAAGVLLAPYAGRESRKLLADQAGSLKNQVNDTLGITSLPKVKTKKKNKGNTAEDFDTGKKKKGKKGKKAKNKNS
jgi:gas vesicle protein